MMDKEIFIKWKDNENGGICRFIIENDIIKMNKIKGNDITFEAFRILLWVHESFKDVRDYIFENLERRNPWKINVHVGMSGCQDYDIRYFDRNGVVRYVNGIHISMYDKVTIPVDGIWLKDVFDILWFMRHQYIFNGVESIENDEVIAKINAWKTTSHSLEFRDVTEKFSKAKEEFFSGYEEYFESDYGFETNNYGAAMYRKVYYNIDDE